VANQRKNACPCREYGSHGTATVLTARFSATADHADFRPLVDLSVASAEWGSPSQQRLVRVDSR
jgi:hypothetical protein